MSARAQEDRRQTELLHKAWAESGKVYGYRKLHDDLLEQGESICPNRVARLAQLAGIPADEEIATVTADGAYDTRACHDAIAARSAAAVIPPRRNARPWKLGTAGVRARNGSLRASKHFGRRFGGTGAGITAAAGWKRK